MSKDVNLTIYGDDKAVTLQPSSAWMRNAGENSWFTYEQGANLTAIIPGNATAVYWNGYLSTGAGEYSVCIDCSEDDLVNNNLLVVHWVDGHASGVLDGPQLIWSNTNLKANGDSNHTLRIRNQLDQRYNKAGLLNIISFVATHPQDTQSTPPPVLNVPVHSQPSNAGFKAAFAVAIIEAIMIVCLLGFIFFKLRPNRKRKIQHRSTLVEEGQKPEFQQSVPFIVHMGANSTMSNSNMASNLNSNLSQEVSTEPRRQHSNTRDYDPDEELENPSDMPRPTSRLWAHSNLSRVSSALSTNSIFRSLAGMFSHTPSIDGYDHDRDRETEFPLSRATSIQSRRTNVASYFDFGDPVQGRVIPRSETPGTLLSPGVPSRGNAPMPSSPLPRGTTPVPFPENGSAAGRDGSKESEGTSRNAVENGGGEGEESKGGVSRRSSCKAEIMGTATVTQNVRTSMDLI